MDGIQVVKVLVLKIFLAISVLIFLLGGQVYANTRIHDCENFWDAYALQEVVEIIQITSLEFNWYFYLNETERPSDATLAEMSCSYSKGDELREIYNRAVDRFLLHYPDEPLPFDQASKELDRYICKREFSMCSQVEKISDREIQTILFIDLSLSEDMPVVKVELENL